MAQIGRYQVGRELGRGAMGIVFEALDPAVGRKVAIKTIRPEVLANPGESQFFQERLFREARSAGALLHPGIVAVFDVGQQGNLAYIAMEYVDGPTLEQLLQSKGKLDRGAALDILRQISTALDYAHRKGVIHRDVKPGNIMLQGGSVAKLTDFGIAKAPSAEQLTRTGFVMGTPTYMSPEHIRGEPLDGRSDQFSLGVVAYEMLTGSRPFASDSLPTLVHSIIYDKRPSVRALDPTLPAAVDPVLHRALSASPMDRFATCEEFVAALEAALSGNAAPAKRSYRAWVAVGAALVVLLLVAAVAFLLKPRTPAVPPRSAVTPRREVSKSVAATAGTTVTVRRPQSSAPPVAGEVRALAQDGQNYVWIPAGSFRMGCSDGDADCTSNEQPARDVAIAQGFWMGQTEVTQEAYQRVMGDSPNFFQGPRLPVEKTSLADAAGYCGKLGLRLPTGAEWEYAARAGSTGARYGALEDIAWYAGNSGRRPQPVQQKQPNAWGLYDMLGSSWEWTSDEGPAPSQRVVRGGSWNSEASTIRVSLVNWIAGDSHNIDTGFRCVGEAVGF
jgi:formylglycine-generating enzyme required for sulfatase activity/tRNA A-37 threonylcarbamoyl transferase component Bud32